MKWKVIFTGLAFLNICCSNNKQDSNHSIQEKSLKENIRVDTSTTSNEKFDQFYLRFHTDSLFQISRILFPLVGFNTDKSNENPEYDSVWVVDKEKVNYYWQRKNWTMNKLLADSSKFKFERKISDTIISESIYIPDSDFRIYRKFKLMHHKWYLVYYSE
jgi:hypothetical protein